MRLRRGNASIGLISICMIGVALMATPFLTAQEESPAQIRGRALALEQAGQNFEAEEAWSAISKADPANAEALAHLGLLEARQQHYEEAIGYYRRALGIHADLPGLQVNLGLALFKAAQFPDAIRSFSAELTNHPGDTRLTILLGMAHYGMKDYLVAIPYLQRALEGDPGNLTLRTTLAHSCLWSRQYQCVVKVQEEMRALNADSAEVDLLAGEALDRMQDSDAAMKALRAAVVANPKEPNVHFALGYLLWTQSRWADAANEFDLEIQNDPQNGKAQVYRADSWVRQGAFAKALPELQRLAAGDPSEPLVHLDLGMAFAKAGKGEDAIRELKMAIESDPEDAEPHLQLANVYRSMEKAGEKMDVANAEVDKAKRLSAANHPSLQELIDSIENPLP